MSTDDAFRESPLYSRATRDELPLSIGDMEGASDTDSGSRGHRGYSSRFSEEKKSRFGSFVLWPTQSLHRVAPSVSTHSISVPY